MGQTCAFNIETDSFTNRGLVVQDASNNLESQNMVNHNLEALDIIAEKSLKI